MLLSEEEIYQVMKKKIFAFILACILASSSMAGCGSGGKSGSGDESSGGSPQQGEGMPISGIRSGNRVIADVGAQPVYCSGNRMFIIKDDNTFELAEKASENGTAKKNGEAPDEFCFSNKYNVQSGTDAYGTFSDYGAEIFHWDLTDMKSITEKVLFPAQTVSDLIKDKASAAGASNEKTEAIAEDVSDLFVGTDLLDGMDGFFYKNLNCYVENESDFASVAFRVMRFNIYGSGADFIGDIRAGELAVSSGFIYYYDAGYTYDAKTDSVAFDPGRAGIYRALADGSNNTLIVSGIQPADTSNYSKAMKDTVTRVTVVNTELFFIDNSESGGSYLYKISTDGGTPEKVSAEPCANFYYDRPGGMLYYFTKSGAGTGTALRSKPIDSSDEKVLFTKGLVYTEGEAMGIYGDYLYFADANNYHGISFIDKKSLGDEAESARVGTCGNRYNLSTGEYERLTATMLIETAENDLGTAEASSKSGLQIKWEKVEPKTKDGTAYYA